MSKPNPSYFQSAPLNHEAIQHKELHFHLYMYQYTQASTTHGNQQIILDPEIANSFGKLVVNDWVIYDAVGSHGKLVAHAQGLHLGVDKSRPNYFICFSMSFKDERFKGSSFKVMGDADHGAQGQWAIVGGTGEFAFAQGTVSYKTSAQVTHGNIRELHIRAICPVFQKLAATTLPTPKKTGIWGGNGGSPRDITGKPRRLESVTIRYGWVIDSLAFTYVDEVGKRHTECPWGGTGGTSYTFNLRPSDFLKKVSGTIGVYKSEKVVLSLSFVINETTYHGPFGHAQAEEFVIVAPRNTSIVGFYGRSGAYLNSIGVYEA